MARGVRRLNAGAPSAPRAEPGRWDWWALAGALALGALIGAAAPAPTALIDWRPGLALAQPWRWWSAAFVHWSTPHLLANLAGAAVVALFGAAARVPPRAALAWALAWPLTHLGLLAQPALAVYGGASGVLHAGVAVAGCALLRQPPRRRGVGAAVLAGLALKLLLEAPWRGPLQPAPLWGIAVAPFAHAAGAAAGAACWAAVEAVATCLDKRRRPPP